jgi:HAD superfamily hydrolase (TIGR01509 family)
MKPKLIIFDLVGTLVFPRLKKSREELFAFYKSLGINLKTKEEIENFRKIFSKAMKTSENWEELGEKIINSVFKKEDKERAKRLSEFLKENLNYQLFEDIKEILNLPFKKAILTDASHFLFFHLNLEKYFQIFTPKETKFSKPDKRAFLKVLEFFKVDPKEAMMVGDDIERDLVPAKNLGMKTILVDRKNEFEKSPFRKINSLKELKEILVGP